MGILVCLFFFLITLYFIGFKRKTREVCLKVAAKRWNNGVKGKRSCEGSSSLLQPPGKGAQRRRRRRRAACEGTRLPAPGGVGEKGHASGRRVAAREKAPAGHTAEIGDRRTKTAEERFAVYRALIREGSVHLLIPQNSAPSSASA